MPAHDVTLSATGARAVTAFICANCARPGRAPDSSGRPRPASPSFEWDFQLTEILVACTGRLQPEHVLKAFESGADLVFTVSCDEDNCQYLQGSERWSRRADYVRGILDEIGLGGARLLHFHLPGTAAEDMALGAGCTAAACPADEADARIAAIREEVVRTLAGLTPNPLRTEKIASVAEELLYQQTDTGDEDDDY